MFTNWLKDRSIVLQTLFLARLVYRIASEEVTLHLLETKCIPVLLYGLEACPLTKNQLSSIDFVVDRFFMKLFKSSNIAVVNECQKMFSFQLPSERLSHRTSRFLWKVASVDNNFIKYYSRVNLRVLLSSLKYFHCLVLLYILFCYYS